MTYSSYDNSFASGGGALAGGVAAADNPTTPTPDQSFAWNAHEGESNQPREGRGRSIRKQDIAEVTSQLAIMTRSGVDIASALKSLASQCKHPSLSHVLGNVHEAVLSGSTLSDALGKENKVFDPGFVATVAAGEACGRMAEVLQQLAQLQRNEIRSLRAMRAMLTYPILLMAVSSSVIVALVLFVLPRFSEIFQQYEIPLPALTQLLIAVAAELRSRWWIWAPAVLVALAGALTFRTTGPGRRYLDAFWIHAAIIRDVYRTRIVARICRLVGVMIQSGVPLLDSLRLTKRAINNVLYKDLLGDLEDAVVNGRTLASALETTSIIPQSAREMIITAESTGNLAEVTQLLGDYYEEEAEARMRQLVGLLEPVITVGMGLVVAAIVLAVMLPVFDLATLAQRGR